MLSVAAIPLRVTVSSQFSMQILTGGFDHRIFNTALVWAVARLPPTKLTSSFVRMLIAVGASGQTDRQTTRYGNICRNSRRR